jgi:hypothetical protein
MAIIATHIASRLVIVPVAREDQRLVRLAHDYHLRAG